MAREPREQLILDLLVDGWVASNTFGLTPKLSYGWWDEDQETAQVSIAQPDEGPINGGQTGYAAMTNGGNPIQQKAGTILCHCWARHQDLRKQSDAGNVSTKNPREYLTGSADRSTGTVSGGVIEEIDRIIRNNAHRPTNPLTGNQPVGSIAPGSSRPVPEDDVRGLFHYIMPVTYELATDE